MDFRAATTAAKLLALGGAAADVCAACASEAPGMMLPVVSVVTVTVDAHKRLAPVGPDDGPVVPKVQVRSRSSFTVSRRLLTQDLNQVSSVSLLMTSLTALANEKLFELPPRPTLIQAV